MDVRDAVDGDAEAVAAATGLSRAAARRVIRERTARLAVRDGSVRGVVAFDAGPGVVHVTRLAGDPDAMATLLEGPVTFARREGMAVELLAPPDDPACDVARGAGFEATGSGPRFEGVTTRRFRLEPG
jgi:hypothetical protein